MKTDVPWQVQRRRPKEHTCFFIQNLSYWTKSWFILLPTFHLCSFGYVRRFHLLSFQSLPEMSARDQNNLCHWSFLSSEKANRTPVVWIVLQQLYIKLFLRHISLFSLVHSISMICSWPGLFLPEIMFLSRCCFLSCLLSPKQNYSSVHCLTHHHHRQCWK